MIYNTVHINPTKVSKHKESWEVSIDKSNKMDREDTKTLPNPLGFYHYPEAMSEREATETLIKVMVGRHEEEIARLTVSKNALLLLLSEVINDKEG